MEAAILLWLHAHASPAWDAVFRFSHVVGSPPAMSALALAMAAWHASQREREPALLWLALGTNTVAIMLGLKYAVLRPRPALWPRIVDQDGYSFPSGHALGSATLLPMLAVSLSRARPAWTRAALVASAVLAAWIGFGRMYLGVHWPTDVAAGWTLGALQSTLGLRWLRRREADGGPDNDDA